MKTNTVKKKRAPTTHEGAPAAQATDEQMLERLCASAMLFEDQHYIDGKSHADLVEEVVAKLIRDGKADHVAKVAVASRDGNLRHMPLFLAATLGRHCKGSLVRETVRSVIRRADEPAELLAMLAKVNKVEAGGGNGKLKKVMSHAVRKGIADAMHNFDAYQAAKYDRPGPVRMRDAMFLTHPKPGNRWSVEVAKGVADGTLQAPDTWEVGLSGGADKKETFTRLLTDGKLGYMALLRNLRNMEQAKVDDVLIRKAIMNRKGAEKVLPFRFLAAAREAPSFELSLDQAMLVSLKSAAKLPGHTVVVVDVSGSMWSPVSGKSKISREEAASCVAAILKEMCESVSVYATGNRTVPINDQRRGMAFIDAVKASRQTAGGGGIYLKQCMDTIAVAERARDIGRVVVLTDEQDCGYGNDRPSYAKVLGRHNYLINVAAYEHGINFGKWTQVNGFSEKVIDWIIKEEELGG